MLKFVWKTFLYSLYDDSMSLCVIIKINHTGGVKKKLHRLLCLFVISLIFFFSLADLHLFANNF